jgi:hypothetical protein
LPSTAQYVIDLLPLHVPPATLHAESALHLHVAGDPATHDW